MERLKRLEAIRGPGDKSECALCGGAPTTDDKYGFQVTDNATGAQVQNVFYLCGPCVPVMFDDLKKLQALGRKGTH